MVTASSRFAGQSRGRRRLGSSIADILLACNLSACAYDSRSSSEFQIRPAFYAGGHVNMVNREFSPGVAAMSHTLVTIPGLIDIDLRAQVNVDISEDRIDPERDRRWFDIDFRGEGVLSRVSETSAMGPTSVIWSLGVDIEDNTTFVEKSNLTNLSLGLRNDFGRTSVTTLLGFANYDWEADDDLPANHFQRDRDGLELVDIGAFVGLVLHHHFENGVVLRNINTYVDSNQLREARIKGSAELPMRLLFGALWPGTGESYHLLIQGEYTSFEVGDGLLPFDEEGRLSIAIGTRF